jgi:hypothetical protein
MKFPVSQHAQLPYMLTLSGKRQHNNFPVRDLSDASCVYQMERDESGEGGSTFGPGKVSLDGKLVAIVSYNGRVWDPATHGKPGARPLVEAQ